MFAGPWQGSQFLFYIDLRGELAAVTRSRAQRQSRIPKKRRAHGHDRQKDIGAQACAPLSRRTAPVMTDHRGDPLVPKSAYQAENVANAVQHRVRQQIVVERHRPGGAQSVAPQVGCDNVEAGTGQRKQLIAPTIGEFWKAVQQHHTRLARSSRIRLQGCAGRHHCWCPRAGNARPAAGYSSHTQRRHSDGRPHRSPVCLRQKPGPCSWRESSPSAGNVRLENGR